MKDTLCHPFAWFAALLVLLTAYQNALTAAAQGGKAATALKNETRLALITALRQNAAYVQSLNLPNLSDVLSSGPLSTPMVSGLDNSITAQLQLQMSAVPNARGYQVQFCVGTGPWQELGMFPNTRGILLKPSTPGTVYSMRVRGFGGTTFYSAWSAVVTAMSL